MEPVEHIPFLAPELLHVALRYAAQSPVHGLVRPGGVGEPELVRDLLPGSFAAAHVQGLLLTVQRFDGGQAGASGLAPR